MSKIDEIRSAMVAAMKAGEKEKKETLSMLLAALKNKQIDKRADLTEEEEIQVIMKEIKQTKETLEMTPADRTDIIEECNRRLTVLEAYAPKMMGEDEIKAIIEGVLSELGIENPTGKDKGNIMKHLMPKVKGTPLPRHELTAGSVTPGIAWGEKRPICPPTQSGKSVYFCGRR